MSNVQNVEMDSFFYGCVRKLSSAFIYEQGTSCYLQLLKISIPVPLFHIATDLLLWPTLFV